jgi:hypothetical protein
MGLIKLGEAVTITEESIKSADIVMSNPEMMAQFKKVAEDLKMIAPKAKDFLYFSAIMMHAAEASVLDEKGKIKKDANGQDVNYSWDKSDGTWVWKCSDPNIKPYKNSNNDIFPEEELIKAHKNWVGRPLCLDHQSSSVDMIRGVIVDTYYDYINKRVVALAALDKVNYPDLARKVSTGYATCVSMGTAVGQAICFDCGNVARTEAEFCDHMRNRSCYGEINVDLNPIELSIVVNGADPKAKIRHIVAAADSIAKYVDEKENLINKMADIEEEKFEKENLEDISNDLSKVLDKVKNLLSFTEDEIKMETQEESEEKEEEEKETEEDEEDANDVVATSVLDEFSKVSNVLTDISNKVTNLQDEISKLSQTKEDTDKMTTKQAYFQGGGGPNEPTPGVPKYPKEPLSEDLRDNKDKQMVGQMDTGPVEGMHPGPDSAGESEEARKKRLQRLAEEEKSALRRKSAVEDIKAGLDKKSYFQGGGGPNEPTPGKPKYPVEDYTTTRDKEDKQMVGKSPFPDVGDVNGLYGDDEKTKQMLARAKLVAKFFKASSKDGSDDRENSRWNVFADKKLILSGTIKDIAGPKAEEMYDVLATPEFGKKILNTLKVKGFDSAESLLKQAEPAPAPAPALEPEAELPPPAKEEEVLEDKGRSGDPKEWLPEALEDCENCLADIRKGVEALIEEPGTDLESFEELEGSVTASLVESQKKFKKALTAGMKEAEEKLAGYVEEMKMAKEILDNKDMLDEKEAERMPVLVASLLDDGKEAVADSRELMAAFVKFAKGTDMIKKAQLGLSQQSQEAGEPGRGAGYEIGTPQVDTTVDEEEYWDKLLAEWEAEVGQKADQFSTTEYMAPNVTPTDHPQALPMGEKSVKPGPAPVQDYETGPVFEGEQAASDDDSNAATLDTNTGELELSTEEVKAVTSSDKHDLTTKEGRVAFREEMSALAQKGVTWQPELREAHPGGGTTTQLDVKPEGELAKVEDLIEQHDKVMDVATAPPTVRKQAADIQKMIDLGKLAESEVDGLAAFGLDPEAIKYWKQYFKEGDAQCSQFATELTKERSKKASDDSKDTFEVKVSRAYDLTYEMVSRGMVANKPEAIQQQVKELMGFNDDAFMSMKRWVSRQSPMEKQASAMPHVGVSTGDSVVLPEPSGPQSDFSSELAGLWAGRRL